MFSSWICLRLSRKPHVNFCEFVINLLLTCKHCIVDAFCSVSAQNWENIPISIFSKAWSNSAYIQQRNRNAVFTQNWNMLDMILFEYNTKFEIYCTIVNWPFMHGGSALGDWLKSWRLMKLLKTICSTSRIWGGKKNNCADLCLSFYFSDFIIVIADIPPLGAYMTQFPMRYCASIMHPTVKKILNLHISFRTEDWKEQGEQKSFPQSLKVFVH